MPPAFPPSKTDGDLLGSGTFVREPSNETVVQFDPASEGDGMEVSGYIGAAAAICSTASFAPQAWKIIRSRDTSSISGKMYVLTVTGFLLWLCYGWLRNDWALILPNAICLVLASFILVMKHLPQREKEVVADTLDPKL
jgi:MtN3 and saliva related transmembrane protein